MTTEVSIINHGPYVITVQKGKDHPIVLEPSRVTKVTIWAGEDIKIVEPEGFHATARSLVEPQRLTE